MHWSAASTPATVGCWEWARILLFPYPWGTSPNTFPCLALPDIKESWLSYLLPVSFHNMNADILHRMLVVDPFAAHPSATASAAFVTYSPVISSPPASPLGPFSTNDPVTQKPSRRPRTAQSIMTTASPSTSFSDLPSPPMSPILSSAPPSQPSSPPSRRRGSLLGAASDALSSFARKTPHIKPRLGGLGRQQSTKTVGLGIHSPQPIILTEVIEISESAVRASKRREEEEEERERLRDAAARALGIGEMDMESASISSRTRVGLQDPRGDDHSEYEVGRPLPDGWFETKTHVVTRPDVSHSRSRSSSYIPPHTLPSFAQSQSIRPSTPSHTAPQLGLPPSNSSSLSTPIPRSAHLTTLPPSRNPSAKSLSSPPSLSVNTLTALIPVRKVSKARLRDNLTPVQDRNVPAPKIPPFPCTHSSLQAFIQRSAAVPRYYHAPSLLMFALSKQWKNRYLVLTSPIPSPSTLNTPTFSSPWGNSAQRPEPPTPAPSYLHLFKNSGLDEKELERLEINENSVVYITDSEVGGRGSVIKVGVMPKKKLQSLPSPGSANGTSDGLGSRTSSSSMGSTDDHSVESGSGGSNAGHGPDTSTTVDDRSMWALQILDAEEAQAWIAAIKSAVLSQRYVYLVVVRLYAFLY